MAKVVPLDTIICFNCPGSYNCEPLRLHKGKIVEIRCDHAGKNVSIPIGIKWFEECENYIWTAAQ